MLNDRQKAFVAEYLLDPNATQAAQKAGYSAKTAYSAGQRLLKHVEVAAAIVEARVTRSERTKVDADWMLSRLADEAEADLADLYDESGALRPVHDWPMIWRKGLVAGIKASEERDENGKIVGMLREVKLSDRVKRLELIGKHIDVQAFKERVEHDVSDDLAAIIEARRARVHEERS